MNKKLWLWVSLSSAAVLVVIVSLVAVLLPQPLPLLPQPDLNSGTYQDVTAERNAFEIIDAYYGEIEVGESVYYFGNDIENANSGARIIQRDVEGNEISSIDFDLPYREANYFSFFSYVFSMQYWAEKEGFIAYLDYHLYYLDQNGIQTYTSVLTEGLEEPETYQLWATALVFIPLDLSSSTLLFRQADLANESSNYWLNDFIIDQDRDDVILNFTFETAGDQYPVALENPFSDLQVENSFLQRYQFVGTDQPLAIVEGDFLEVGTSWGQYLETRKNTYNFEFTTSVGRYALMTLVFDAQRPTKAELVEAYDTLDLYGLPNAIKASILTQLESTLTSLNGNADTPRLAAYVTLLLDLETLSFTDAVVHVAPTEGLEFNVQGSLVGHLGQSTYLLDSYDSKRYEETLDFYGTEAQGLTVYRIAGQGSFETVKVFTELEAFSVTSGFLNADGTMTIYGGLHNLISNYSETSGVSDAIIVTLNLSNGDLLQSLILASSLYDWVQYATFDQTTKEVILFVQVGAKDGDFDFVTSELLAGPFYATLTFSGVL